MSQEDFFEAVGKACEAAGSTELDGRMLENPSPELLDVRNFNLDDHSAVQPAGIAYYGKMKKAASRMLLIGKDQHEKWCKRRLLAARRKMLGQGKKPTKDQIETQFLIDDHDELKQREMHLNKLQRIYDDCEVWYEAWRTKGFSMREYAAEDRDERMASPHITEKSVGTTRERHRQSIDRVRRQIREKKDEESENQDG